MLMTGDVAAVNAAVEAGSTAAAESGLREQASSSSRARLKPFEQIAQGSQE